VGRRLRDHRIGGGTVIETARRSRPPECIGEKGNPKGQRSARASSLGRRRRDERSLGRSADVMGEYGGLPPHSTSTSPAGGELTAAGSKGAGMNTKVETTGRDAVLVEDAARIRVMGTPILEALPSRGAPYERVDPFILVHEGRVRLSDVANVDTKHPHRGFDNLWYLLEGSASTGHSTGPGGAMERARLSKGALLALRTGRGAWHAEALERTSSRRAKTDAEFRGVLFWVNLARKDKGSSRARRWSSPSRSRCGRRNSRSPTPAPARGSCS